MSHILTGAQNVLIGNLSNSSTVDRDQLNSYTVYYRTERKPEYYHITGTEEEEAEYEQYDELGRGDFTADDRVYYPPAGPGEGEHKFRINYGQKTVFTAQLRSQTPGGSQRITVIGYSGKYSAEAWKQDFQRLFGVPSGKVVPLHAINRRSRIPLLIFTGNLVPVAHFIKSLPQIARMYLVSMKIQLCCVSLEVPWMDPTLSIFCRGPIGPRYYEGTSIITLDKLPTDVEMLKEDVLSRRLGQLGCDLILDRKVARALSTSCRFSNHKISESNLFMMNKTITLGGMDTAPATHSTIGVK
ncbi:hypothetical protein V5O48_014518 [Marasmius crinis-equi]|uniref:Uncharacterized protein n=1 Tax=Marasmius crinis-equi TaxID=585013 RepID=A0ABR3EX50_9AGAR